MHTPGHTISTLFIPAQAATEESIVVYNPETAMAAGIVVATIALIYHYSKEEKI